MLDRWIAQALIAVVSIAATIGAAYGHHGPEDMIAMLTKRIDTAGATPVLLYKRATEWRTLGKLEKATADLDQALQLNSQFVGGIEMLAEIHLMQGKLEKAETAARAGISASTSAQEAGACQMILARVLQKQGNAKTALAACNAAFESYPRGNIDWYLIRGVLQRKLGLHDDRVKDFRAGYEQTGSTVLRNSMVDAQIDAGRATEVLPLIDKQVEACRLKSSWLLRRARAFCSIGKNEQARDDLTVAIEELERRIHPIRPDVTLIIDRGLARALLGDVAGAMEDLERARDAGASATMLVLLVEAVSSAEANRTSG